jgi:hypothetical protein
MSTTHKTPDWHRLPAPIVEAMPRDALEDLAEPRRFAAGSRLELCRRYARARRKRSSISGRLLRVLREQARARLDALKAEAREKTREAIRELESGDGTRYESLEDFFAAHGI